MMIKLRVYFIAVMFLLINASYSFADDFKCGTKIVQQGLLIEEVIKFCPEIEFEKKHYETQRLPCTKEQIDIRKKMAYEQGRVYTEENARKCRSDQTTGYDLYVYKRRGQFIRYLSVNEKGMIVTISTSSDKE